MSAVAAIVSHQASGFLCPVILHYSTSSPHPSFSEFWGMEEKELTIIIPFSNLKVQLKKGS